MTDLEQRLAWKDRMIRWMIPRLAGDGDDKEQFMELFTAALAEAHNEGIDDAQQLLARLNAEVPSRPLKIAADALAELARRNRANPVDPSP